MSTKSYRSFARRRNRQIKNRLKKAAPLFNDGGPTLGSGPVQFDTSERIRAISCGGIGAIHTLVNHLGLPEAINSCLHLLKINMPYLESDHVLNIAYNALLGGKTLQDIELRRNDPAYLDAIGTPSIPDPTTAGDFARRFSPEDILALEDAFNDVRKTVWARQPKGFLKRATIDFDGTIAETPTSWCKQGMEMSYKGKWGYQPLIVSLANTGETLFAHNRPGNAKSSDGFEAYVRRAIDLVRHVAETILLRGDTDFYRAKILDEWVKEVDFVFGVKRCEGLRALAEGLSEEDWTPLERVKPAAPATTRSKPERVREGIVKKRGYTNLKLNHEDVAEFRYTPTGCKRDYRLVVLRKNITKQKGEKELLEDIRYFYYITSLEKEEESAAGIVRQANERCNQENMIEQAKNGVGALGMGLNTLEANGAYMVMALLATSLKAWLGLLMPHRSSGLEVVRMEYKRFRDNLVMIPAQVVLGARQTTLRFLSSNDWLIRLCSTWDKLLAGG